MSGSVALIGFMGAGKSTAGPRLAARLSLPFVDLDDRMVEEQGVSIADLFARDGEEGFRRLESDLLERVLRAEATVVATGGGVVEAEANRIRLREASTVLWLDARLETLRSRLRIARGPVRPLAGALTDDQFAERYRARRPRYAETAHFRFEVDDLPVGGLVRAMVLALRAREEEC